MRDLRDAPHDRVERGRRKPHQPPFPACRALGVDHVVSLLGELEHVRDRLRLILKVRVHDHRPDTRGVLKCGDVGARQAEIAAQEHRPNPGIPPSEVAQKLASAVGGHVVDHDQLPLDAEPIERPCDPAM